MAYGTTWGTAWGGGALSSTLFEVTGAIATGSNSFRVGFSKPPQLVSPIDPADASRLANWTVTRTDLAGVNPTLLTARRVPGNDLTVEFIILERWFASALAEYTVVGAASLRSVGAEPIVTPAQATFNGLPPVPSVLETGMGDIRNTGGLVVTSSGDYDIEFGERLIRKLVTRRIFVAQGEFYHLADIQYGLGLQAKDTVYPSDLPSLKKQIELAVATEPGVEKVRAGLELDSSGTFTIKLAVKLFGLDETLNLEFDPRDGANA